MLWEANIRIVTRKLGDPNLVNHSMNFRKVEQAQEQHKLILDLINKSLKQEKDLPLLVQITNYIDILSFSLKDIESVIFTNNTV